MRPLTLVVVLLLAGTACAQTDIEESIRRIREYKNRMAIPDNSPPALAAKDLRVGANGRPDKLNAKVMQIVNDKRMLVGVEDAATGKGDYELWVAINCDTKGIEEGRKFSGKDWLTVVGGETVKVTGTTTYKTVIGGLKTVLVLVPTKKPTAEEMMKGSGKPGAAAYDNFPPKMREALVKDWNGEIDAIKKAIKGDEERLKKTGPGAENLKYQKAIAEYQRKLAVLEKNSPPYYAKEAEQAIGDALK